MGTFHSGRFRFQVERSDWSSDSENGFEEAFDNGLDLRLVYSGKLPDLGGAPIASWLLARLAKLTDNQLGLAGIEHNDGGGYVVDFVVYRVSVSPAGKNVCFFQQSLFEPGDVYTDEGVGYPVASFQFQADMEGAAVLGRRSSEFEAEDILAAFATALLAAPTDLTPRELVVKDPEWKLDSEIYRPQPVKGSRNSYGWDGSQFLGQDNIRDSQAGVG